MGDWVTPQDVITSIGSPSASYTADDIAYLEFVLAFTAYLLAGWGVITGAFKTIRRGLFFDENVLMVIATGGAFVIHAYAEVDE